MKVGILCRVYDLLLDELGPQHWWPADTAFEVVVGAMLTQQTKWTNVEKAIEGLKENDLLEVDPLSRADPGLLEELVRCCGFYRQKASRLKGIAGFFAEHGMENVFSMPVDELRRTLLSLKGVGNETADSIVLYAAEKPKFVIDAYTTRMMKCIGIEGDYMQLQGMFEEQLPKDVGIYKEYHALIVEYSKAYCGRNRCNECILKDLNENGY
ncbi:endonuclease III domain-containing protein [Methanolobus profundi]|uniref:DNA-3-methyladenine glycosylase III n=1 Tax=Methanolobus profundi TaxID=487685 RepID=A0A1I4SYU0_9EURY|nr:endonuclease [Methanolobus profundi]SFM69567.1 DNA-3-methyladenine glycosylase III [Methanolobus profundi]